jgi:DNA-binding response OmpR family regulator
LVLIVEDEAIIGFEVADALLDGHYRVAGPFNTCATTLGSLAENKPDVAILDVLLKDGPSTEIARALRDASVPFIVYSGSLRCRADEVFADALWLDKPIATDDLLSALAELTSGKRACDPVVARGHGPKAKAYRQCA